MKSNKFFVKVALAVAFLFPLQPSYPCTAVDFQAEDGTMIASRTMDWFYDMQWEVVSMPEGSSFSMTAPSDTNLPALKKTTKYGIIGIVPGILQDIAFVEGQNTAGLGMSINFLPGEFTQYQKVTRSDKGYVSVLDFGTWVLGMFSSVTELKAALPRIKVWYDSSLSSGPTPPFLHYIFTDKSGKGIIVEFIKGKMQIHDNKAHVFTNAPPYDWHIHNLRNYINVGTTTASSVRIGNEDMKALGPGGSTMALRADYSSPSRFVRAAFLRWHMPLPKTGDEALQATVHILNNVDVPKGISGQSIGNQTIWYSTQWTVLKDLTHNRFYLADYNNRTSFIKIDLNDLSQSSSLQKRRVSELSYSPIKNVSEELK